MAEQLEPELRRLYEQMQGQLAKLKELQAKKQKQIEQRHQLLTQRNENVLVKEELSHLEPDAKVYKLIGPVMVSQDTGDAKTIVEKRLEYINAELKRCDQTIAALDQSEEDERNTIVGTQTRMQERHQALQAAAAGRG